MNELGGYLGVVELGRRTDDVTVGKPCPFLRRIVLGLAATQAAVVVVVYEHHHPNRQPGKQTRCTHVM